MALLGNLKGSAQVFQDTEFYNGVATQSLRFDSGSSAYLTRTYGSGNQALWTASMWIKRSSLTQDYFFGSQASGNDIGSFSFNSSNQLVVNNKVGSSTGVVLNTDMVFRDVSAWYHLVVVYKGDESSATNRAKIYVNGSQVSTTVTESLSTGNGYFNSANTHGVGRVGTYTSNFFNGYMAEVNLVDGYGYDPTYFGETKNGVWIPKAYTGSYGTNGFRLEFKNTSVGSGSSSTIGADTSGNDNHFTSSGIVASDCNMPDSPENNFSTMNPLIRGGFNNENFTFSEGNLKIISGNSGYIAVTGSTHGLTMNDKIYAEVKLYSGFLDRFGQTYGVADPQREGSYLGSASGTSGSGINNVMDHLGRVWKDGSMQSNLSNPSSGDIIGIAFDGPNSQVAFYKNGSAYSTITSISSSHYIFLGATSDMAYQVWNFGQNGTFLGTETSQGNTDENGNGDFYYAPPSGHLALCTTSFLEPTVGPNSATQADDHFNTVLWSGNSSTQAITGLGFQPDWVWGKTRSGTYGHGLYDTSRGISNVLSSESTNAESSYSSFSSFDSDGFTLGSNALLNESGKTYVAWNWKANGGTTSSNSNGSITSTVQANQTAGFSIVQYEATGSAGTVGHGLSQAPTFMIVKSRDQAGTHWIVYYGDNTDYVALNDYHGTIDGLSAWNDTSPTSTVFSVGSNGGDTNNTSGGSMIAYIFHDVDGYSKFGSYFANNSSSNNAFVYTGFRPAFILVKGIQSGLNQEWVIMDNKKSSSDGGNPIDKGQYPNYNYAEYSGNEVDFLSNGFKVRATAGVGYYSGQEYIYLAFAEDPFKYANAR